MKVCSRQDMIKFLDRAKRGLRKREWPTDDHYKAYADYEKILVARTHINNLMYICLHVGQFCLGYTPKDAFESFKSRDLPYNEDLIDPIAPKLGEIILIMALMRIPIAIACVFKPKLIRYVFYYQMAYRTVNSCLPRDYGDIYAMHNVFMLILNFYGYYFQFWPSLFSFICVLVFKVGVVKPLIYFAPLGPSLWLLFGVLFFGISSVLGSHIFVQWLAEIYVDAEVPRSSNETMLNGLKESVFIIEKESG